MMSYPRRCGRGKESLSGPRQHAAAAPRRAHSHRRRPRPAGACAWVPYAYPRQVSRCPWSLPHSGVILHFLLTYVCRVPVSLAVSALATRPLTQRASRLMTGDGGRYVASWRCGDMRGGGDDRLTCLWSGKGRIRMGTYGRNRGSVLLNSRRICERRRGSWRRRSLARAVHRRRRLDNEQTRRRADELTGARRRPSGRRGRETRSSGARAPQR
jgi:hypothetical protein